MKEWNGAGDHKETAGERKVKMERKNINKKTYCKEYYCCTS